MTQSRVKSLDNFTIEVFEQDGLDYVDIHRTDKDGKNYPGLCFKKGDAHAAEKFLLSVAELVGVKLEIVPEGK